MKQVNATLYGSSKGNKVKEWKVFVDGCKVIVEYGYLDGKKQTQETLCEGKNIGRANETSPVDQAFKEAESKWTKQKERKLYVENIDELTEPVKQYPMLAKDAKKVPHMIKYPCDIQPKLDGVRVLVEFMDKENNIRAISRRGVEVNLHQTLHDELFDVMVMVDVKYLDGELYLPGYKLQEINSASKNTSNPIHHQLQFHCFDVPSDNTWDTRKQKVELVSDIAYDTELSFIKGVRCHENITTFEQIEQSLETMVASGFEGVIIRNHTGRYEWSQRSSDLLKLKEFQDSEAKVIGCKEDKLFEGVLECEWTNPDGHKVEFEVKMKGNHESRTYNNALRLIGKWINFTYQDVTKAGRPSFPVGQALRDCDKNGEPVL